MKFSNAADENSEGNLVYLSPGVRLCGDNGWATTLSVGIPIIEELNGVQYGTDVRAVFGLSKGF